MVVLRGLRTVLLAPVFVVGTLLAAAVVVVISLLWRDAAVVDAIVRGWSRFFIGLAGSRLEVEGAAHIDRGKQYVFIANHLSNLDIPAMFLATDMPIRYLAKAELFRIPIFAQAMSIIGIVRVDRVGGAAIHSEVNAGVVAATGRGHSLIVFPEGTRSADGKLTTFKKGAFRIAISNQLDVIPVTLVGTWEAWRPHSMIVMGGPLHAVVHDPISVEGLDLNDIEGLRAQVHEVIAKEYASWRP